MKIIGIGKDDGIIVQMTENEMLKVSGVAGKTQIAHRFKPGMDINIAPVYDSVARINEKQAELRASLVNIKAAAADIENSLILTDEA